MELGSLALVGGYFLIAQWLQDRHHERKAAQRR